MSRVMYSYRLPKDRWWDFARDCRDFYAEKHPLSAAVSRAASSAARLSPEERAGALVRMLDLIRKADEWFVDLQLFDEGDTYLIRPLERWYMFLNHHARWTQEFGLEPVFYDDRSDVPPELEKNREVSLWCDDKIARGEYLLYQVVTEDGLSDAVMRALV